MISGDKQHLEREQDAPTGDNYNAPLPKFHLVIYQRQNYRYN
ncbi:hypothetical protein [Okeania sp. KiyG1]|nr:hypothetical protein [Okeania sp. KiyG1]